VSPIPRIDLMGVEIDPITTTAVVERVREGLEAGSGGWIITPNLDQLRLNRERDDLAALFAAADLVVADGMPLVWASRLRGTPLPERVAGSDLVWLLSELAAEVGAGLFLLGGDPGAAGGAAATLVERYPGLRVAGTHSPPFGFEDDAGELDGIDEMLAAARPRIVFVALGFPKQDHLIARLTKLLPDAWFIGCGISLSFISGDVPRAPRWMRRTGLEWIHRLIQEPRRLAARYLIHDLPFAALLFLESLRHRIAGRWR
jgi:N-acetylglucosaminyldiphosphoundecaprenol N-acetyl-beta-D-mannosaminyltransferase